MEYHICEVLKKANSRLYLLKLLKYFNLPIDDLVIVYSGFVRPTVEYAAPVRDPGLTVHEDLAFERIQKRACSIIVMIFGKDYTTHHEALELFNLRALHVRHEQLCLSFFNSLLESDRFDSWVPPQNLEQFVTNKVHCCT